MAEFEIECTFVCKDPEWSVAYTEHVGKEARSVAATLYEDTLEVGTFSHWDDPKEPLTPLERERVLDRLAEWAFAASAKGRPVSGIRGVFGGSPRVALRLPTPACVTIDASRRGGVTYVELGRTVSVRGVGLRARDGLPALRLWLDTAVSWQPGGAVVTEAERAAIATALRATPGVTIEISPSLECDDPWALASSVAEWRDAIVGFVPESRVVAEVLHERMPRPAGPFWNRELVVSYEHGRTGWNLRPPHAIHVGPLAAGAFDTLRDLLFAVDLPVEPEPGSSRGLLSAWDRRRTAGERPPSALSDAVQALIVPAPDPHERAVLAIYADTSLRFLTSRTMLVHEAGVVPELCDLARAALAEVRFAESGETRALTCAGQRSVASSAELDRRCTEVLRAFVTRLLDA